MSKCDNCNTKEGKIEVNAKVLEDDFSGIYCDDCYAKNDTEQLMKNTLLNRAIALNIKIPTDVQTWRKSLSTTEAFQKALQEKRGSGNGSDQQGT